MAAKGEQKESTESADAFNVLFAGGSTTPKQRGTSYFSAGGGEAVFDGTVSGFFRDIFNYLREEHNRPNPSSVVIAGPDLHTRPPSWLEDKSVGIDGAPVAQEELEASNHWQHKYRRELDVAAAVQEVKKQRRVEQTHDVIGSVAWVRRKLGWLPPNDESLARRQVEARHRAEDAAARAALHSADHAGDAEEAADTVTFGALPAVTAHPPAHARGERRVSSAWKALLESTETGKPLVQVAREYRPRIDFYGLDPFLDSASSLIWFSTKCGVAIGMLQGTIRAIQAIHVDVQFLRASGVGVLSVLNMSVLASVIKWGGNTACFASAFCVGDRLATAAKRRILPPHDAQQRSTVNYVAGLAASGATVGVMPWWVLSDAQLAARLAVSGLFVGGVLGLGVGLAVNRLISLNLSRLDATPRQLRRYESLILREREWAQAELQKQKRSTFVWW